MYVCTIWYANPVLRPLLCRSYRYYATYCLPGINDEVQTAAQTAKMQQQGGGAPPPGVKGIAPFPPAASASTTWHVPLQHCGVHWVQAGEALAAALEQHPLRLKVYRATSKSYGKGGGSGAPAIATGSSGQPHTWVSSVLAGEAVVDMSSLISMLGIRKHQPSTRCDIHVSTPGTFIHTPLPTSCPHPTPFLGGSAGLMQSSIRPQSSFPTAGLQSGPSSSSCPPHCPRHHG